MCEYRYPAILVDKVNGAVSERLQLSLDEGVASQEDDWKSNAAFSKGAEQLKTGHPWQAPVEQGNSRLNSIIQCVEKRRSIRKSRDRKPAIGQICHQGLSIKFVVVNQSYVLHVRHLAAIR